MIISEAVRELRKTLGESQQAFSNRLGLSISSVTHYEGGQRSPDYAVTLGLYRVACEVGRKDLAAFFLQLIKPSRFWSVQFTCGTCGKPMVPNMAHPFQSENEPDTIRAVRAILSDAHFQHLRGPLEELLAPVKTHLRRTVKKGKGKK